MISQFIHIYLIKLPPFVVKIKLVANLKACFLNVGYIKCIYQNYSQLILVKSGAYIDIDWQRPSCWASTSY